jgi:FtsH-binding integral membrane protein
MVGETASFVGGDPERQQELGFTEISVRQGFIRKVYSILMLQLLITSGFIALFIFLEPLRTWVQANSSVLIGALVLSLVLVIVIVCSEQARRRFPMNFFLLFAFTVVEGFLTGAISSSFETNSILLAAGITVVICLSLTLFAFQTKYDFTGMGPYLFVAIMVLILFGVAAGLLSSIFPVGNLIYSCLGALLFSVFLVYDTQLIVRGDHQNSISPEEYTFAALTLYLDILNIFLKILAVLGSKRD